MMRFFSAMIIVALTGQAAHALDAEDSWVEEIGKATKACGVLFDQKFGKGKNSRFVDCMTEQTAKAAEACIGSKQNEFASCVSGRALSVMQACDLTRC
jgi:hypothetical protein